MLLCRFICLFMAHQQGQTVVSWVKCSSVSSRLIVQLFARISCKLAWNVCRCSNVFLSETIVCYKCYGSSSKSFPTLLHWIAGALICIMKRDREGWSEYSSLHIHERWAKLSTVVNCLWKSLFPHGFSFYLLIKHFRIYNLKRRGLIFRLITRIIFYIGKRWICDLKKLFFFIHRR